MFYLLSMVYLNIKYYWLCGLCTLYVDLWIETVGNLPNILMELSRDYIVNIYLPQEETKENTHTL